MLPKIGSYKFHIESYVCDFKGKATLPIIGNFILQAATLHASERGFGYDEMSESNAAWVLSRLSVQMNEYPGYDQYLTVETWIEDVARFFTQRCFRFIDKDEKVIGYARTIWAAIDMKTRRPIDINNWKPELKEFIEKEKDCPIERLVKINPVHHVEPIMGYSVRYSDIDINKHMNSIKYIEHVINIFDLELFKQKMIHRFEMVYLAEGGFGDKFKLYCMNSSESECIVDTKREEESICRSRIIWK